MIPNYSAFLKLQKQITERQIEVKEKQEYINSIKKIKADIEEYQEFLVKIESSLPQDVSLPSLLNFFQNKASSSGLVMDNMAPSAEDASNLSTVNEEDTVQNERIKENDFQLSVMGSFESFRSFLLSLEKSSRLVEVQSILFDNSTDGGTNEQGGVVEVLGSENDKEEGDFKFNLSIKVYSY